jgi:hypothetical protein
MCVTGEMGRGDNLFFLLMRSGACALAQVRQASVWRYIKREPVVSDQFEPVSVCPRMRELMLNKAGANRIEQRFG